MSNKYEKWQENNPDRWANAFRDNPLDHRKWDYFARKHLARNFPVGTRVKVRGPSEGKLPFSTECLPRPHTLAREDRISSKKRTLIRASASESGGIVIMSGPPAPGFSGILVRHDSGEPKHWDYYATELVNLDARERIFGKSK